MSINNSNFNENLAIVKTLIQRQEYSIAHNLCKNMLTLPFTDDKPVFDILEEQAKCESIDNNLYCSYNSELVDKYVIKLAGNKSAGIHKNSITITTTTCKRLDLFIQTVNSFLECCLDIGDYLYEWIVIDDNSSDDDRKIMKKYYPFINFIYKTPDQKGHARSMNMLIDVIKTPYVVNLEDDWRFFTKDNYLTKCLDVLNENDKYGQCLFNRSFGEDLGSVSRIVGGYRRYTKNGLRYYIHEYLIGNALQQTISKLNGKTHCIYWPHYSLRVGITRTSVFKKLGYYNEKAGHFEQDYAYRYYLEGRYLTTYLDSVYCTHIGRRTYERDTDKLNAYDLNEEKQFGQSPKTKSIPNKPDVLPKENSYTEPSVIQPAGDTENLPYINTKLYVLNLERRKDRLDKFYEMNIDEINQFHVFKAIDGMNIKPNHKVQKLFQNNDYNYRRGIVGCALSHIAMWDELIKTKTLDSMIILEDDAELSKDFMKKVMHCINISPEADIIFFGHHPYADYAKPEDNDRNSIPVTERWNRERCVRESMGGTTGYYITRNGVKNMFKFINEDSIRNGIDWVMFKTADINKIYYCSPFIAFADCFQNNLGRVDTDIQSIYDGCGYKNTEDWMLDEIKYFKETFELKGIDAQTEFFNCENDPASFIKVYEKYPENKKDILNNVIISKDEHDKIKKYIKLFPVKYYTVNEFTITIPENKLNEKILNDKTFNGFINNYIAV